MSFLQRLVRTITERRRVAISQLRMPAAADGDPLFRQFNGVCFERCYIRPVLLVVRGVRPVTQWVFRRLAAPANPFRLCQF